MKFQVKNRFTGSVQFEAEIECDEGATVPVKLGLAVRWAIKARANLAGASLARASLARADLAGAYLAGANLARANLADANLARASLARADLAGASLAGASLARANLADANLAGASLAGASLAGASLARASLARADLAGASGNMAQIRTAQIDTWPISWTTAPDGIVTIQIGCQRHTRAAWAEFSDAQISRMDTKALAWWLVNRDFVLGMVDRFPAAPYGALPAKPEAAE